MACCGDERRVFRHTAKPIIFVLVLVLVLASHFVHFIEIPTNRIKVRFFDYENEDEDDLYLRIYFSWKSISLS
jgi:glucan phosphoethanolaminetransferase (alkaline phosphatase superfamily)